MKRALIPLLLLMLLLGGCGTKNAHVDQQADNANILSSEKAYVLLGYSGYIYSVWMHTSLSYADQPALDQRILLTETTFGTDYYLLELVPGNYTAVFASWDTSQRRTYLTEDGQKLNEQLKHKGGLLGSFTAEKGKITYIGDLNFKFIGSFVLEVKDAQAEALKWLGKEYPKVDSGKLLKVKLAGTGQRTR